MTVTTSVPRIDAGAAVVHTSGAGSVTAALQSAKRTVLQFFRTPQLLMLGTIQGALFLFMFRYIFGGAIHPARGLEYVDFLAPGFLVTGILWLGMPAAAGVAEDAATGVHDRLRSLPIPRSSVMIGRSLADAALTLWGIFIAGALAFIVGFRPHAEVAELVLALALLLFAAYSFMWVFITIGLASGNAQAAQGTATLLVIPLAFVSAAYVPADTLPDWMQPVADNQPFTIIANAVRSLTLGGAEAVGLGHGTAYWVALSFAWCVGILTVFGAIAVSRFARPSQQTGLVT
jgi:ABC-2 type transport system permease protein